MINAIVYELTRRISVPFWIGICVASLAAAWILRRMVIKGRLPGNRARALWLLSGYLLIVLSSTVLCRSLKREASWQLQPFWSYWQIITAGKKSLARQNVLNILLFLPIGFLLPAAMPRCRAWKKALLVCLCLSYGIELLQLVLLRGTFELVDDPLHNTLGGLLGYGLFSLAQRKRQGATGTGNRDVNLSNGKKTMDLTGGQPYIPPAELKVFLELLRAGILGVQPDLAGERDELESLNLNLIRKMALNHSTVLTVYGALELSPEPVMKKLQAGMKKDFARAFAKTANQECEGEALLDAVEQAGLDCIPLKGWLMRSLYALPLTREMTDLDILFRNYDFRRIEKLMAENGFLLKERSSWKHDTFVKAPFLTAELHKRLTDDSEYIQGWEERLWDACELEEGREHIFRMKKEDYYLFHLLHMHKDFLNGALSFRRLADLWLLGRVWPELDRTYLEKQMQAMGVLPFAQRMERLSRVCFAQEEADPDSLLLMEYAAGTGIEADAADRYKIGRMAALSQGQAGEAKLKSILCAVFLPPKRMKAQFPVLKRYPFLLPVFWAERIVQECKNLKYRWRRMDYRGITQEQLEKTRLVFRAGGIEQNRTEPGT